MNDDVRSNEKARPQDASQIRDAIECSARASMADEGGNLDLSSDRVIVYLS
jgi:hypothetical protein